MSRLIDHSYILCTILFTVYSQLIIRWQVKLAGELPSGFQEKSLHILQLLVSPWVLTAIIATLLAGMSWMLTMTRFEISYAFPFISMTYVLMLIAGFYFFGESLSLMKLLGTLMVVSGLMIIVKG